MILTLGVALACCTPFGEAGEWTASPNPETGKPAAAPAEAALVYDMLQQLYATDLRKPQATLLVVQETIPVAKHRSMTFPQDFAAMHRYLESVRKDCVSSFLKANKQRYLLPALPDTPPSLEMTGIARVNQLFHTGGWQHLLQTYPRAQALISLARPGTCGHHEEALLYTMATRGNGGGEGTLTHAKRDGDAWMIVKKAVISQADSL